MGLYKKAWWLENMLLPFWNNHMNSGLVERWKIANI